MKAWLEGWVEALRIMIFDRELYHQLTQPLDLDEFVEVGPPEDHDGH